MGHVSSFLLAVGLLASGLAVGTAAQAAGTIQIVAAENFYGDLAAQIGGAHVAVTSILSNPDTDPHLFESSASTARSIADAEIVLIDIVLRQLPTVMRFDAGGRDLQRAQDLGRNGSDGRIDLRFADAHRRHGEIDAVELLRIVRKGCVAACPHIVDDGAHHGIHILGHFPLRRQESGELLLEPFRRLIQPDSQN